MTIDEQQLIAMLSDPSTQRKAFEVVVREYSEQLYWQVRRIVLSHEDANDVMQNVMLKAWTNLDSFRKDSKLPTWLFRIAINESLDYVRRQKHNTMVSTDDAAFWLINISMVMRLKPSCRKRLPSCPTCSVRYSISATTKA